jgi:conjugative transfer pilus assembly protein TraH
MRSIVCLKNISILCSFLLFFVFASISRAAWVDDWIDQATISGPDHFETQKRNYANFGGVSARWDTSVDPLITYTPPRFRAGCGGIDAYMGGFSFMDEDHLMEKFENIMSGDTVAAFAFDIALNVLCEPCANTIKALEAISDRLNQVQLDDCKASRVIATTIVDGLSDSKKASDERTQAWSDFKQSTGVEDLFQDMRDAWGSESTDAMADGVPETNLTTGCPPLVTQAFFTDGFLLENLSQMRDYPDTYVALMRGLLGDVEITDGSKYTYHAGCKNNNKLVNVAESIYTGEIEVMPLSSGNVLQACRPLSDAGIIILGSGHHDSYRRWVQSWIEEIAEAMVTQTALTNAQEQMLRNTPADVYMAVNAYLLNMGTNSNPADIAMRLADWAGSVYIYSMFSDYYKYLDDVLSYADHLITAQKGSETGGQQHACQIELAQGAMRYLKEMKKQVGPMMQAAYESHRDNAAAMKTQQEVGKYLRQDQLRGRGRLQNILGN